MRAIKSTTNMIKNDSVLVMSNDDPFLCIDCWFVLLITHPNDNTFILIPLMFPQIAKRKKK